MSDRSLCSLSDAELDARRTEVRAAILPHLEGSEHIEGGFAVTGRSTPELRRKLERLVTLERRCCSSVDWQLSETDDERLRLEVRGLEPGSTLLGSLAVRAPRSGRRAARAGVAGVALSLLVLCGLPLALSALGAGALGARLAGLESPLSLALVALLAGSAVWLLARRREQRAH